jgi:hypothetical protein
MDNRQYHRQYIAVTNAVSNLSANGSKRTFGGLVFWTDVLIANGWRVQTHIRNGKARLLDPQDSMVMAGNMDDCQKKFTAVTASLPQRKSVVMVVHPMGGSRLWMRATENFIRAGGFCVESFTYASLLEDVPVHAARLSAVIDAWQDVTDISFVTLSLGGPVVAHMLAANPDWRTRMAIRALVMMGPPAQGAALARIGRKLPPARATLGPALMTLAGKPMPTTGLHEIAILILAGKIPLGNPLLRGADDGIVRVEETRIDVPHQHMVVAAFHAGIQRHPTARRALMSWLEKYHHD